MQKQWEMISPLRAAAIDLGSNSFRLLIAERDGNCPRPVLNRLVTVGLGEGLEPGRYTFERRYGPRR